MEESAASFVENPILNSPYEYPTRHWELDKDDHPTGKVNDFRRPSSNCSPIAAATAKSGKGILKQDELLAVRVDNVEYHENDLIQSIRAQVDKWRDLPEHDWHVTAETARLLKHWRHFDFPSFRPFFCQIEAIETLIWLVEVAPSSSVGKQFLQRILDANMEADPNLYRIALKLATGAGKTTVMAMIIAWQTINALRHGVGDKFTNGFLITAPGLTIRDRLRVLLPNDSDSYYAKRQLVPKDLLPLLNSARIVITNYHAFALKETLELSKGTKSILVGPSGVGPQTTETPKQMLRRVIPELIGLKNILMINDEAHHCYRHRPEDDGTAERKLDSDEKEDAKKNEEAARLWISGLEAVHQLMPKSKVIDLSATPFFLRGSGYSEGTLFHWTVCDFSLMDALECGIVKLPRIPLDDSIVTEEEMPKYRDLWANLKKTEQGKNFCKIKSRSGNADYNPQKLPNLLQTAIEVLYNHYTGVAKAWKEAGISTPPCMVIVCQNTAISKLIYDFISGYMVKRSDGTEELEPAKCELFSNYDEFNEPLARPNTLLIDSFQLESGDALDKDFRKVAAEEIELYKQQLIERTGDVAAANKITDADLLREVMNTVGKKGQLGEQVRCVVSVSMLTEGWDANNVTHILGVRAFGTQLLCEQVVGRALRRLSYELDTETGHYRPEYADIFGIPFNFASGTKGGPVNPPDMVRVHAVHPERDMLEIRFPNVSGYYLDREDWGDKLSATFTESHALRITQDDIGPILVLNGGFVGENTLMHIHDGRIRPSEIVAKLANRFINKYAQQNYSDCDRTLLFRNLRTIFTQWLHQGYLRVDKDIPLGTVLRSQFIELACERVNDAIIRNAVERDKANISVLIDDYYPSGSTLSVNFLISRNSKLLYETSASKSHINYAVCDSTWEAILCRVLEGHRATFAYVKNYHLGFTVPYVLNGERRNYIPDFIVLVDDGHGKDDPLHLIIEVKGYRYLDADAKKNTMETYWIPGVNRAGNFGRWAFIELNEKDFSLEGMQSEEARLMACAQAYDNAITNLMTSDAK